MSNLTILEWMSEIDPILIARADAPCKVRKGKGFRMVAVIAAVLAVLMIALSVTSFFTLDSYVHEQYEDYDGTVLHLLDILLTRDDNAVANALGEHNRAALHTLFNALRGVDSEHQDDSTEPSTELPTEPGTEPSPTLSMTDVHSYIVGGQTGIREGIDAKENTTTVTVTAWEQSISLPFAVKYSCGVVQEDFALYICTGQDAANNILLYRIAKGEQGYERVILKLNEKIEFAQLFCDYCEYGGETYINLFSKTGSEQTNDQGYALAAQFHTWGDDGREWSLIEYHDSILYEHNMPEIQGAEHYPLMAKHFEDLSFAVSFYAPPEDTVYAALESRTWYSTDNGNYWRPFVVIPSQEDMNGSVGNIKEIVDLAYEYDYYVVMEYTDVQGNVRQACFQGEKWEQARRVTIASELAYSVKQDGTILIQGCNSTATRIEIPAVIDGKTVTEIGTGAFISAVNVRVVSVPGTVKIIRERAFENCATLESIVFYEGLEEIRSNAFAGCQKLYAATLPSTLLVLGDRAFANCTMLHNVNLPPKLSEIGSEVFSGSGVSAVAIENGVQSIGDKMFYQTKIDKLIIPKSVQQIGYSAFADCTHLTEVVMNQGLATIEDQAFANTAIQSIVIPATVNAITELAFLDCKYLARVFFEGSAPTGYTNRNDVLQGTYPSYTVHYRREADGFTSPEWCGYATAITPDYTIGQLQRFGDFICEMQQDYTWALGYYGESEEVEVPAELDGIAVTTIKSNGFESAKEYVRKVTLPDSIIKIDFYAFYECTSLEQINLPKDLCHIGSYAFASCTSLKHISIPAHAINQYSHGAFGSSGLETVELADGIQMLTSSLFAATKLTHVEIPASVKVIEYNVFGSCTELTTVTLHEGLERMDAEVFKQSKITEIEIPASVCELDAYTFGWCDQLRAVRFHGNAPDGEYLRQNDDWGITLGSYTVYYHADAQGFTSPEWYGYPTEIW